MNNTNYSAEVRMQADAILSGDSLPPGVSVAESIQLSLEYIAYNKNKPSRDKFISYLEEVLECVCECLEPEEAIF